MRIILNVAYLTLVILASPWLIYSAIRKGKYREGWPSKFLGKVPRREGNRPCIWFHAVSVGEANLLATVIPEIEREMPEVECVISVTTKTAFEMAREKYAPRQVFYCPLDFSWAVRNAMSRVRPGMLVLAELELWPNLIREAKLTGAKVALINGRLSARSFRGYHKIQPLVSSVLKSIDLIATQNEDYAERFQALGAIPDSVHVTGSLKFDGAKTDRDNPATRQLTTLAGIHSEDAVLLAGSTQDPEEQMALDAFNALRADFPQLRLILVPRHPHRFDEVATLLDRSKLSWQRRTQLETTDVDPQSRILLVDTIGELGAWWGTAHIAFVGGSMGTRGGQNMIEPAAYGAAVSFGPKTRNFRDVVEQMLRNDAAVVVNDAAQLQHFVQCCLSDPDYANRLGSNAQKLVRQQQGAAFRTTKHLLPLISNQTIESRKSAA